MRVPAFQFGHRQVRGVGFVSVSDDPPAKGQLFRRAIRRQGQFSPDGSRKLDAADIASCRVLSLSFDLSIEGSPSFIRTDFPDPAAAGYWWRR